MEKKNLLDDLYDFLDGKLYTVDGVQGRLRRVVKNGRDAIEHEATALGKKTDAYRAAKSYLHGDYVAEINDFDRAASVLGFVWWDIIGTYRGKKLAKDRYLEKFYAVANNKPDSPSARSLEDLKHQIDMVYPSRKEKTRK